MRTIRTLAAFGVVVIGSFLVGVSPASAGGPSISVTPSTGIVDGQTVTVSGTGFTVGTPTILELIECANVVSPVIADCDTATFEASLISVDDFVQTYTATRLISTANQGSLDCAVPGTCVLGAAAGYIGFQAADAPITFTTHVPTFHILNARLVRRVGPAEPVELRVRAVNTGPSPVTWSVSQSNDVGLTAVSADCPDGRAQAPGLCVYSPARPAVGQPVTAVFTVEASPGFAGTAYATVCATDLDDPGSGPPSNMCEVVTTFVG